MTQPRFPALILSGIALTAGLGFAFLKVSSTSSSMTSSAQKYVSLLDEDQKKTSLMTYETPERLGWHFIPKDHRKGLQIKHMDRKQRKAAYRLLNSALSETGYDKATKIMALEGVLKELERNKRGGNIRDPERYYYTVFGEPNGKSRWGLSIEGHHLSLNFVVEGDRVVSSTPAFFAANPTVLGNDYKNALHKGTLEKGLRVLAKEETLGFDLVNSLSKEQRVTAIIGEKAPREIRAAGEPQPPTEAPVGVLAKDLNDKQHEVLDALINEYAATMPADVAAGRLAEIDKAGRDSIRFAWAGPTKPGIGHYYRVEGPTFLIEFVNTQPDAAGNPASHIHCVWRDPRGDFAVPNASAK